MIAYLAGSRCGQIEPGHFDIQCLVLNQQNPCLMGVSWEWRISGPMQTH